MKGYVCDWVFKRDPFLSERTVELFRGKLLSPHTSSPQSRLHLINTPWPLTVYLNSTHEECIIVDQLRKHR